MKAPGLDNAVQPINRVDDSLSWLAEQIAEDLDFPSRRLVCGQR